MEDVTRGFNHTILCMGQAGVGKTTRLFGRFAWAASCQPGPCCLLTAILRQVLDYGDSRLGSIQIGLSFWEVCGDEVRPAAATCPRPTKGNATGRTAIEHAACHTLVESSLCVLSFRAAQRLLPTSGRMCVGALLGNTPRRGGALSQTSYMDA